ncbi:FecR domain-containing protein [Halopseudomonas oceani]|uniref:FecR family protein n=1 Tax=Halopseudomonas oceani TaxID=1708783 RepID=UPI002AA6BA16|nr:FecR domain-containing protein [Halopseudomonas oceani]
MRTTLLSQDVINQAVMHLLAYREATDPERYRATVIAQWCRSHPDNQRAWQRVDDINARLQPLRGQPVKALAQSLDAPGLSRRDLLRGGGALMLVAAVGSLAVQRQPWQRWQADARTGSAETFSLRLDNGTEVLLNARTTVHQEVYQGRLRLWLLEGEALLTSHRFPTRDGNAMPLEVITREAVITPIGTRFSVKQQSGQTRVAVHQGEVKVSGEPSAFHLQAGEAAVLQADGYRLEPVVAGEDAWRNGLIVANRMPLGHFVARLNHYHAGLIQCAPAVAALEVSGTYPLDRLDEVLAALHATLPLEVQRIGRIWIRLSERAASA